MKTFEEIKDYVANYFVHQPVAEVYLCGSYAKGNATEESDIDLLLFLKEEDSHKPKLFAWSQDLEEGLGCEVELFIGSDKTYTGYKFAFFERLYREKILLFKAQENG